MEGVLRKAQRLYKANKLLESLSKYEKVIQRRFSKYNLIEVNLTKTSKFKPNFSENVSRPIEPSCTMMFNINTQEDGELKLEDVQDEEEKDIMFDDQSSGVFKKRIQNKAQNDSGKQPKIDEKDSIFLSKIIKEFNIKAMQYFNTGNIEKADKILKRLMAIATKYCGFCLELVCLTLNNMS